MNGRELIKRRTFLKGLLGSLAATTSGISFYRLLDPVKEVLSWDGPSFARGHRLWLKNFLPPKKIQRQKTLIIGGGVSGLSAAYWLKRNGIRDFTLLELEDELGGNSRSLKNSISSSPTGAHYLPAPAEYNKPLIQLLRDFDIIKPESGITYREEFLCHDPAERLFIHGRWQEGIRPHQGLGQQDHADFEKFDLLVDQARMSGEFTLPLAYAPKGEYRNLDKINFKDYLLQNDLNSPYLHWYADYCCLDDFGHIAEGVSAWAGLHYFAARSKNNPVLTWPEGNAHLINKLKKDVTPYIKSAHMAYSIEQKNKDYEVKVYDFQNKEGLIYQVENVVFASPDYIWNKIGFKIKGKKLADYRPWVVANITLNTKFLREEENIAWDNVNFHSQSLGYVHAKHQDLSPLGDQTVITYYLPFTEAFNSKERKRLLSARAKSYKDKILADLEVMHPGIEEYIVDFKLWRHGHGMVSPGPNYIWGRGDLEKIYNPQEGLYFIHSDISGISLFEEAHHWGHKVAMDLSSPYA